MEEIIENIKSEGGITNTHLALKVFKAGLSTFKEFKAGLTSFSNSFFSH